MSKLHKTLKELWGGATNMGEAKRRKQLDPSYGKPWWQQECTHIKLETEPDYTHLVNLYLFQGTAGLTSAIFDWLVETKQIYHGETPSALLSRINQVSMTVYNIASKQVQSLTSHDPKLAAFMLKFPLQPEDFQGYQSVLSNRELATEAMRLINTGFFDGAITFLLNKEGDAVATLRKHGIVLYMGTNNDFEIIDAACALVTWKPFVVSVYAVLGRDIVKGLEFCCKTPE